MEHNFWMALGLAMRLVAFFVLARFILPKQWFEVKQENGYGSTKKMLFVFGNLWAIIMLVPVLFYFGYVSLELTWMVSNVGQSLAVGCLYVIYFRGGK